VLIVRAFTAGSRTSVAAGDVMIDPFGNKETSLPNGGLRMVDPVKRCARLKGVQIIPAKAPELAVGRDNGALTTPSDQAFSISHYKPLIAKRSQLNLICGGHL
jgi:hypothetical protein